MKTAEHIKNLELREVVRSYGMAMHCIGRWGSDEHRLDLPVVMSAIATYRSAKEEYGEDTSIYDNPLNQMLVATPVLRKMRV